MATYSAGSGSWTYYLYVNETAVDQVNNTSTVSCKMTIYRANSQYSYIQNGRYALKVTINGVTQTSGTVVVNKSTSQPEVDVTTLYFTVPHNDDGTGTASITYCQFISSGGTNPATATLGGMPKNITLTYIPRASDITCASPVTMGTSESVTVTQKSASFSHILYYSTDSGTTWNEIGRDTATKTYSWSVPDLSNALPNATSATYDLKCETYMNGTYSDTPLETTLSIVANVPASYVPTVTIGTITEGNNSVPVGFPFIVGHSKPTIPTTFTGSHNSTVVSRSVNLNGETLTSTSAVEPVSLTATRALSATNTPVTATVIDSRGRTGSDTATIAALAYNAPAVEIDCTRCQSDGTIDPLGTYVLVLAKWTWTSVINGGGELNSADIDLYIDGTLDTTYNTTTNSQNTLTQIAILSGFAITNQYTITATISDELVSSTVSQLVTKAQMPLSLYDDGNDIGVTIGRMATQGGFNNWLDMGLVSGNNVNLYDNNAQVIQTMTTDDLFNGGGGLAKFVKGTPIDLYDTDGTTVLYSRNPENLVFYDGQEGQNVASNFIFCNPSAGITLSATGTVYYPSLVIAKSKGNGFEIASNGDVKCNKNGTVKVTACFAFGGTSSTQTNVGWISHNRTVLTNSYGAQNNTYTKTFTLQNIIEVVTGDTITMGAQTAQANAGTWRADSTLLCEYIEDYYITNAISESNTYSTSEIEIGRWIDNKPIYRKVWTGSVSSGTSGTAVSNVISSLNIDTVVNIKSLAKDNDDRRLPAYYWSSTDAFRIYISGGSLMWNVGSSYPVKPFTYHIIMEYTKTTD